MPYCNHTVKRLPRHDTPIIRKVVKTCLKSGHSKEDQNLRFTRRIIMLNADQKYCRMLHGIILQYFWPALRYHMVFKPLFYLFLSGHLRQVSLYSHFDMFSVNHNRSSTSTLNVDSHCADSRWVVVSYKWKYVHTVLVNCLVKLAQEKVWLGKLTVNMTIAIDRDFKNQTKQNLWLNPSHSDGLSHIYWCNKYGVVYYVF